MILLLTLEENESLTFNAKNQAGETIAVTVCYRDFPDELRIETKSNDNIIDFGFVGLSEQEE